MAKVKTKDIISSEEREKILNYSNEIVEMKDYVEHVRLRPGMYIGPIGNPGFINMIREIVQNCFDEIVKGNAVTPVIYVKYNQPLKEVQVTDNCRGIPFGMIEQIFSKERTSSNFNKKKGEFASGMHGVGGKVVNALSSKFIVESFRLGEGHKVEFYEGRVWDKGEVVIKNPDIYQGTRVTFIPSTVMEKEEMINLDTTEVFNLLDLLLPLAPIGTKIMYTYTDSNNNTDTIEMENKDGILKYIIQTTDKPLIKPIIISEVSDIMKVDIMLDYDTENTNEVIVPFANFCPTRSGTHVDGLRDGLQNFFRNYMNKIFLNGKKKAVSVINSDILYGLKAVISAAHIEPVFTGQAKEHFSNKEMRSFVSNAVMKGLDEWAKANPKDLQRLCTYLKDVAEIRIKADKERIKVTNKYAKSALTGLPAKYVPASGKKDVELILVEGDSAGGSIKNNRIHKYQSYLPLRGKVPNAFRESAKEILSNEELAGIINILGCGYGKNCDPSKCRVNKIIIMTDADPDGDHISVLLLKFFILYLRPLVEAGMVYRAVPPLYGMSLGKDKYRYFTNKVEYTKYVISQFSTKYKITTIDDKSISEDKLVDIFYRNLGYVTEMDRLARSRGLNPYLLELVLMNRDKSISQLQSILRKHYRFMDVSKEGDITIIKGLVDNLMETIFFDDRLIEASKKVLKYIDVVNMDHQFLKLNGEVKSMYTVMSMYENETPPKIQHYKGLGEMDGHQLFDSTVNPDTRTLIRYTIEDAAKEIDSIRYYDNNMNELLVELKGLTREEVF